MVLKTVVSLKDLSPHLITSAVTVVQLCSDWNLDYDSGTYRLSTFFWLLGQLDYVSPSVFVGRSFSLFLRTTNLCFSLLLGPDVADSNVAEAWDEEEWERTPPTVERALPERNEVEEDHAVPKPEAEST